MKTTARLQRLSTSLLRNGLPAGLPWGLSLLGGLLFFAAILLAPARAFRAPLLRLQNPSASFLTPTEGDPYQRRAPAAPSSFASNFVDKRRFSDAKEDSSGWRASPTEKGSGRFAEGDSERPSLGMEKATAKVESLKPSPQQLLLGQQLQEATSCRELLNLLQRTRRQLDAVTAAIALQRLAKMNRKEAERAAEDDAVLEKQRRGFEGRRRTRDFREEEILCHPECVH